MRQSWTSVRQEKPTIALQGMSQPTSPLNLVPSLEAKRQVKPPPASCAVPTAKSDGELAVPSPKRGFLSFQEGGRDSM